MKRIAVMMIAFFLFAIFWPNPTGAGQVSPANIIGVDVRNDGTFLIDLSQSTSGAPACATTINRLSANSGTTGGKALLQLAISVYLSGRPVSVTGTGTCTEFSNIESIAGIHAQ